MFMASRPLMSISIDPRANNQDSYCYLEDSEGRRIRSNLPHSNGMTFCGATCGYLVLFSRETRDLWLVNPITRHQLHFPYYPFYVGSDEEVIKAILVFSPSIFGLVFVVLNRGISRVIEGNPKISFCIAGKQIWNHVSSTLHTPHVCDLHVCKEKIYTLHKDCSLRELRPNVNRPHKWMFIKTNNIPEPDMYKPRLVSSNENLYVFNRFSWQKKVLELDFCEMKWVSPEKTIGKYVVFISLFNYSAAIKPESWLGPQTQYKTYDYLLDADKSGQPKFCYYKWMWYFFHDCLNVNLLDV